MSPALNYEPLSDLTEPRASFHLLRSTGASAAVHGIDRSHRLIRGGGRSRGGVAVREGGGSRGEEGGGWGSGGWGGGGGGG